MSKSREILQRFLILLAGFVFVNAVPAAEWSSSNVQLLHGSGYELGEEERTIFTLEHANRWTYGDNFFFVDATSPGSSGTALYAEFSPRLSIGGLTGSNDETGFVKDTLIAATIEMGEDVHAQLLGIGLSLDVAEFNYLNVNFYLRRSYRDGVARDTDTGGQVNVNWNLPFVFTGSQWFFEGHLDYAFSEDGGSNPKKDNLNAAPRLLLDLGHLWEAPGHILAGIEYQVWRNKFGIDGVDEDVAQLMLKWIF